jgi:flagellar biosynthesis protein FlhF
VTARRFVAPSWELALAKVRRALGADAVILESRRVERRSPFGWRRRPRVEITAAAGVALARDQHAAPPSSGRYVRLEREVRSLRDVVHEFLAAQPGPGHAPEPAALAAARAALAAAGVDPLLAQSIATLLRANLPDGADAAAGLAALRAHCATRLAAAGPIAARPCRRAADRQGGPAAPYRVALVGPTGVGKTTTLAKLAATLALRGGAGGPGPRVGLLTTDTFRIAAVEQLARYAEILTVPFRAVREPAELRAAMDAAACDVWLLDTAGRSPRDEARLAELAPFLQAFAPDETHLVLAAPTGGAAQSAAWQHFARLQPTRLLLTKLDEATQFGFVLELAARARLPISYLTAGQQVPDDLEVATPERLVSLVLGPAAAPAAAPEAA